MFRGSPSNPYDDIVIRATDESQTSENWSLFIEVCDKTLNDKTPTGPRECIASIQKRLQHRNANVQLLSLTLTESLVKNTNENLHRELASRAFMKVLSALVLDRYTHEKVKKRVLQCLKSWSDEFHGKLNLGLVEETLEDLKSKGFKYEDDFEAHPSHPSDDVLKREEEELQRALEESEREAEWNNMSGVGNFPTANSSSKAHSSAIGPTGYLPSQNRYASDPNNNPFQNSNSQNSNPQSTSQSHRINPESSLPLEQMSRVNLQDSQPQNNDDVSLHPPGGAELYPMRSRSKPAPSRVKALYDFDPSEEGELAFREGELIRVIDSAYKDWWKGELRGQVGIFPVNYVEAIPDPSPELLAREAEIEASVFAQAHEIDRLLQMMRNLDAKRDNLADNDELSELYQQTLSLRPKIVRLIEKYTQKKAELLQINAKFMTAKTTYDSMIEESLAKHHPGVAAEVYTQPNPNMHQNLPPQHLGYGPQPAYPTNYGYEQQAPYLPHPSMSSQSFQHPSISPVLSQRPQYVPDSLVPEGIDTSRYYLASDGNWYAFSAEQLAANAAKTSQVPQVSINHPASIQAGPLNQVPSQPVNTDQSPNQPYLVHQHSNSPNFHGSGLLPATSLSTTTATTPLENLHKGQAENNNQYGGMYSSAGAQQVLSNDGGHLAGAWNGYKGHTENNQGTGTDHAPTTNMPTAQS
ncbi:hypothetical protein PPACK8108_LOCUS11867 [Phakopsora pachyrhizi]|uniref:Class E vacuolar protein-sorting machinery protein HSE1 n=1 Tax=Phakopsora pachyrhizi TaxID=170000 RepID=A0AAV0B1C0_PHAPC|nr:hypothetical protein PPACK8108_LOCUS11867 [Phakopsora pachyrhizi]